MTDFKPEDFDGVTHHFNVGGFEGYLLVDLTSDKRPHQLRIIVAKEGSTLRGFLCVIASTVSMLLQRHVPLSVIAAELSRFDFAPNGTTTCPDVPFAESLPGYVLGWMVKRWPEPAEASAR